MIKEYLCSMCHRLSPAWVKPPDPYICIMCRSDRRVISHPERPKRTGKSKFDTNKYQWGILAAHRIAEDLSVQLETDHTGQLVREIGGNGKFVQWLTMYGRLYQRKNKNKKKERNQ